MATEDVKSGPGWEVDTSAWPLATITFTGGPTQGGFDAFLEAFGAMYQRAADEDLDQVLRTHIVIRSLSIRAATRVRALARVIRLHKPTIRRCVKGTAISASGCWFYLVAMAVSFMGGHTQAPHKTFELESGDADVDADAVTAWFDTLAHREPPPPALEEGSGDGSDTDSSDCSSVSDGSSASDWDEESFSTSAQ